MPTTKKRINITVDPDTEQILRKLAKRAKTPLATKATELLKIGIEEFVEDLYLYQIAEKRSREKNVRYIPHEKVWKKLGI